MAQAMTKYQLDHFRDKVKRELDPMIEQQELLVRQYVSQATDTASKKLAKKIGAQSIIDKLKEAEAKLQEAKATANVNTALPIGTAGQVLRVNSGATAPEWAATDAGGLTKISVTSFTSVSAISLANDSFTTTYNNYLALIKITGSSSSGFLAAKLRLSGTDATGSDYYYYGDARNAQSGSIAVSAASTNVGLFFGYYQSTSGLLPNVHKIEIYNPKLAERTSLIGHSASSNNDVINQMAWVNVMGFHSVATAYDSMSIVASAGNISGTITLYGYEV